jgi:NAD(P)-dependent dehydrogenase (short-subunit alcohol dehydrogenase family)
LPGRIEGKVAVVTGGGSGGSDAGVGIGQAISIAFAREGGRVLVVDKEQGAPKRRSQASTRRANAPRSSWAT